MGGYWLNLHRNAYCTALIWFCKHRAPMWGTFLSHTIQLKKLSICCVSVITWQHIFIKPQGLITLLWYARLLIDIMNYAGCCTGIPHEILSTGSTYFVSEAFSHIPWPSSADGYLGDGSVVRFGLKGAKMASDFFSRKTYYVLISFASLFL